MTAGTQVSESYLDFLKICHRMGFMAAPVILLIEDNQFFCIMVSEHLEKHGFHVVSVHTLEEARSALPTLNPDLVLLDVMLPDGSGLDLIPDIRQRGDAPILVLSGKKELDDKISGLNKGADDYLAKPLDMAEVTARIQAHLRRYQPRKANASAQTPMKYGAWTMDRGRLQFFDGQGASANLTPNEYRLLEALMDNPDRVLTRDELLQKSHAGPHNTTSRAIDVQVLRIRKKLGDHDKSPHIKAIRGIGYIFVVDAHL